MTETEALALLGLDVGATPKQIRSHLFQEYQRLTGELSQLDDERKRPLIEAELDRLNQARDLLLSGSSTQPHPTLISQEELPETIAVLLYQQGRQEGIYTQRIQDHDLVIAFVGTFAARKYAQLLMQKGLPKAKVEWFDTTEIVEFCQDNGYGLVIIPAEETVAPPDDLTAEVHDWGAPR